MNLKIIFNVIGRLLIVLGILMLFPVLVGIIYREPFSYILYFLLPIAFSFLLGFWMIRKTSDEGHIYTREAMFTTAFCWLIFSIIGAIPLYLTPSNYHTFLDAFFEMASGFTTCGASVATNVELLPNSIIFWRSFSHLIGGMGILVFTLAIIPKANRESSNIMKAEVPGPTFGKITPRLSETARVLYKIYLVMAAVTAVFLLFGGMDLFDSIIYAMGAAGTGGFANRGASIGYYDSRYIEIVLSVAMLLFGVNFNLYYYAIYKSAKESFKSEELWTYIAIVIISTILIFVNISGMYDNLWFTGVNTFFTVSSVITTTGYVTVDFGQWPFFSRHILTLLMFIGGCAGSTAGGLKVSRIIMLFKSALNQVKTSINPLRVTVNKLDGKRVDTEIEDATNKYFILYIFLFLIFMLVISTETHDFESAFTAVAATINNIGPAIGEFGPVESFAGMGDLSKFTLTLAMLFGRLELYPMILLVSPVTYKNLRNK